MNLSRRTKEGLACFFSTILVHRKRNIHYYSYRLQDRPHFLCRCHALRFDLCVCATNCTSGSIVAFRTFHVRAVCDLANAMELSAYFVRDLSTHNLGTVCGLQSARGWLFAEIMHLWFNRKDMPIIEDWVSSVGDSAAQGIKDLDREKRNWIPARSTSNFAFVIQNVLVCIQNTVTQQHDFDKVTFWQDFARGEATQEHGMLGSTSINQEALSTLPTIEYTNDLRQLTSIYIVMAVD